MARHLQTSFASGELAPALHARVDISRFVSGLKLCRNFVVRPYGGAANRPGSQFLGYTAFKELSRLIPFAFSSDQTYAVELGGIGLLRWFTAGKRVNVRKTAAAITNGAFVGGITGWTDLSTGAAEAVAAGAMAIATGGTPIGDMDDGPGMGNAFNGIEGQDSSSCPMKTAGDFAWIGKDWGVGQTRTITRFRLVASSDHGFKIDANGLDFYLEGSPDNFVTTRELWRGSYNDGDGLVIDVTEGIDTTTAYRYHRLWIEGGGAQDSYVAELGFYTFAATGSLSLVGASGETAAAGQGVSVPVANRGQIHVVGFRLIGNAGQLVQVRVGSESGGDQILQDKVLDIGRHSLSFVPAGESFYIQFRNPYGDTVGVGDVVLLGSGAATDTVALEIPSPYLEQELFDIGYTQSADVVTLTHAKHPPRELRRYGALDWSLVDLSFAPGVATPAASAWSITGNGGGTDKNFAYVITYEAESGEESLPTAFKDLDLDPLDSTHNIEFSITFPYPTGVVRANVYKYRAGRYGWIGASDDGYFIDDGIQAGIDITPPTARNPFEGVGNYPEATGYFEQRQWFGGSDANPDTVYGSRTGVYRNFGVSEPLQDNDAITLTLASREVNRIRHLVGMQHLLIFTSGAVWRLARGDRGLTPANEGGLHKQLSYGAAKVQPIEVGNAVLFVQEHGRAVRDLVWDVAIDAYGGEELSQLAHHLLQGRRIVDWAWQGDPLSCIWLVRDDGVMLSLTYNREQQVVGWAQHDTAGQYRSVCCISEPGGDAVYAVVRRRIGNQFDYMVERFASRIITDVRNAHFVDCGVIYTQNRPILALTRSPFTVTAANHGCVAGDFIDFGSMGLDTELRGTVEVERIAKYLNGKRFKVTSVAGNILNLGDRYTGAAVDTSGWPSWIEGGVIRKAVATVTGLAHLEGETVAILADGNVSPEQTVIGGAVTLPHGGRASQWHVGLPYSSDLETLPIPLAPELFGRRKAVKTVQVFVEFSRGLFIGPTFEADDMQEKKQRLEEEWDQPTQPQSGMEEVTVRATWTDAGTVCVRQKDPLPLEVLGLEPVYEAGGG